MKDKKLQEQSLAAIGAALDGLDVAYCVFDAQDRCVVWNAMFEEFFPEHAGHVHAGEPYQENLRRFYRLRLGPEELPRIERYVAEGVERHRTQRRPYEFDHSGFRVRASSTELGPQGRVRVWRRTPLEAGQARLRHVTERELADPGMPILQRLADGVLVVDQSDNILWANQSFLGLYRVSSLAQLDGKTFDAVYRAAWANDLPSADFERSIETLSEKQRFSGAPFELALPGSQWVRVIEQRGDAVDGRGYFVHVDITTFKRQQLALRQAEALATENAVRLRAITDSVPVLISEWSLDERVIFANRMACDIVGISLEDALGTSLIDVRGKAAYDALGPKLQAVRAGQQVSFDTSLEIDGSLRHFQQTYVPNLDASGKVVSFYSVAVEMTQRKELEDRLARSERFMRYVTDNIPLRISYVDTRLRHQFVNRAHLSLFMRSRDEILGRTSSELTDGATDAIVLPAALRALAGEVQMYESDEIVDGQHRCFECRLIPDMDEHGVVRGLFATGVDVTERKAAERALRELADIFDRTPDFVIQTDGAGVITYVNEAGAQRLGSATAGAAVGRQLRDLLTAPSAQHLDDVTLPWAIANGVWVGEAQLLSPDDASTPVSHMVIAHRSANGDVVRFSSLMRDISADVAAREQLDRQTATLRSVAEAIPALVAVVDPDMRYRFVNKAFARWTGLAQQAIPGRHASEVLSATDFEITAPFIERALKGEEVAFERDFDFGGRTRHLLVTYVPLRRTNNDIDGFVGVLQDITVHKDEQLRLLSLTEQDPLTSTLNRLGFRRYLARLGSAADSGVALLYVDLDYFKQVNDTRGHAVGDAVLKEFARRLQNLVRPTDAVARLGGDEFAVVLTGIRESRHALLAARKIVQAGAEPFAADGAEVRIGASIGIAFDNGDGWEALLRRADEAVYRAKADGRGRIA